MWAKAQELYLVRVLAFGFKYLRPYLFRFVLGVVLGIVFAALNGAFVGLTVVLVSRLTGEEQTTMKSPVAIVSSSQPSGNKATANTTTAPSVTPDAADAALGVGTEKGQSSGFNRFIQKINKPFHGTFQRLKALGTSIKLRVNRIYMWLLDPWLPLKDRALDWKQIMGGLLILPLMTGLRGGIGYLSSYFMAWTSQRLVTDLKADVFEKLNTLSLDFFNKSTTANILARINGDTAALNSCLRLGLSDLVKEPMTVVAIVASLLYIDWQLTLLALFIVPLMVVPMQVISRKVRKISRSAYDLDLKQGSLLMDAFANIRIVQAFGLQKQQTRDFLEQNRRSMRMGLRTMQAKEILNPIIELFAGFGLAVVIVFVFASHRPVANFFGFAMAIGMFFTPLKKLAGIHIYFVQTEVPMQRLMELFAMEPTVRDTSEPVPFHEFRKGIRLRDVAFDYTPERPVLRQVNIDVPYGQKIGLAGESGSGKSTLINLLFRFYDPTGGHIEMDGVDIRQYSLADMRKHMALVSQDVLLFNTTVAENIGLGKIGASREEIIEAARNAAAHDFILKMPEGYDTQIGERGVLISGGQRQRLAIARAFVRNAPILVLDEATASLDSQSEAEVQEAIDRLANGRTVVCIAHRLSTLKSMDRIYVMKDGQVIEEGGFEELLRKDGAFAMMARRQSITASSAHSVG
jgi:ATP-binding cassette, subfamily B, bacterial MsbA